MMRRALLVLALAGCGDPTPAAPTLEIVGHSDLGARGMNAALALAGTTAYVGARNDEQPILIVDVADPSKPTIVGELGMPAEALTGMSSRELRAVADLDLLVVLNLQCSPSLHGCAATGAEGQNLKFFDISDRLAPRLVATHAVAGGGLAPPSPHEFFLWRDPADPARVLVLLAAPGVPSVEIIEVVDKVPTSLLRWDPYANGAIPRGGEDNSMHSIGASDDGRVGYLSHQTGGLGLVDLSAFVDRTEPAIASITTAANTLKFGAMGPHSAITVPGRPLLVTTEEVYPPPHGAGCPWGHVRTVDISDPTMPALVGEYRLPENDPSCAADAPFTAFTAHNATATENIALVTWYAGGLQLIDISDASAPSQLVELRPDPLRVVAVEDPGLGGSLVHMWSYPVIQDGLIYVVDSRNGLYVLRYSGRFESEISERAFLEGNSNLGVF